MANTLKIKRGTAATIPQGQLAEPLFTTDTYDLYIGKGSGGNQRIQNYIASGTSSQFLKGDGSLDSNTYQTALTFSSPLVNTSGTVTINQSSGTVDGYLSSTDWTTFNSKEPAITAGTTLQYYRGDKTFQTLDTSVVPENGPIYFTEPRVRATVLTGLNLSGGGTIAATDSILTAFGKVQNQISALVGGATYQGTWNASTNTPTLASGTGTKGYYYVVSVAGSTNLDGITDWKIGDWAIFNGTTWDKVDNTDAVSSVNGFTGAVNLGLGNISDVALSSPTNAQLLRFNGTSSKWENWTPTYISGNETITLSGDISGSGTTTIATTIGALKVTNAMLAGSIDYAKMDATTVPTWNQNTTGNAATATKLATARTLTIGATGKTFDGSANVSWSASEIGLTNYLPLAGGTMTGDITISGQRVKDLTTTNKGVFISNWGGAGYFGLGSSANSHEVKIDQVTAAGVWEDATDVNLILGSNRTVLHSSNYSTYALPLTGGTLTGDLTGKNARFNNGSNASIVFTGDVANTSASMFEPQNNNKTSYFGRENSAGDWVFATPVTPYSTVIAAYNTTAPIILGHTNAEITIADGGATTFSSTATINGKLTVGSTSYDAILLNGGGAGYNTSPIGIYNNNYPNDDTKYFSQYGGNWASSNNWGMGVRGTNDSTIYISAASNGVIDVTKTDFDLQLGAYKAVKSNRELTINGTTYDLSASRTWNVGTVTGSGADTRVAYWTSGSGLSSASNFIWDYTNNRLGIGASSPLYTTHIQSSGEANLAIETNNDSATNFSGFRRFKSRGTPSAKTTIVNGDTIAADGHYAYDGTQYRAVVSIVTQSNGVVATNDIPTIYKIRVGKNDASLLDMISLTSAGAYQLNQLTSNGFVKTTGGTGTLSIDTTIYAADSTVVHLAGTESITGAKTFTSKATFNGTTYDAILLNGGGGNTNAIGIFNQNYPSADDTKYFAQYGGNWASSYNWGMGVRGTNDSTIYMSFSSGGVIDVTSTTFNLQLGAYKVLHAGNYNSYALPLTGGTLTGALNGTSATFSSTLQAIRIGIGSTPSTTRPLKVVQATPDEWIAEFISTGTTPYGVYIDTSANASSVPSFRIYSNSGGLVFNNNGRLGIGTSSPSTTLHIVGDTTFDNYRIKNLGATNQGIFIGNWPGAGYWGLGSTGTAHELRLDQCDTSTGAWSNATDVNLYLGTRLVLNSANYSSYALPITGGTINSSSTQPLAIYGDNAASNGLFRVQIDEVNDSFGTGTRTFLGDGGIDIFIGTGNSSYTPANTYIALNQSGEISMGAGSATKMVQLSTTGVFQVNTRVYNAIYLSGSSGAANPMGVMVNDYPSNDNTKYYAHYGGNWQSSGNWGMGVNGSADSTVYLGQAASGVISTAASVNFKIWGNSYAAAFFENSDKRQKELIQDNYIVKGIENISAKYYLKNGVKEVGYYAQDFEGILDSALSKTTDGFLNLSYNQVHTVKIASLEKRIKELEEQLKNK